MRYVLNPAVVLVVAVASLGITHGIATNRWETSEDLRLASERLDRVPTVIGSWVGTPLPIESEDLARAGIRGSVYRRYQRGENGPTATVLLVCGRGGPISVHTPDVCYAGAGYRMTGAQERHDVEAAGNPSACWTAVFAKPDAIVPVRSRLFWCWSRDGRSWDAPDSPRATFARFPAVYKLYVAVDSPGGRPRAGADPMVDFLPRLLSELQTVLTDPQ